MDLALDAAAITGLLLAIVRVTAFVTASPLITLSLPWAARLGLSIAVGLAVTEPVSPVPTLLPLLGYGAVNAALGALLGYATGALFQLFSVAGGLLDMQSGLAAGAILDPATGSQASVFNRLFTQAALALLLVAGGWALLVRGLATSIEVVALDATFSADPAIATELIDTSARMLWLGVELALPVAASLFLVEIALGLASRFAPQANVFLLGLPLKVFVALASLAAAVLAFPGVIDEVLVVIEGTFVDVLRGVAE